MTVITHAISEKKDQKTPLTEAVDGLPTQATNQDTERQASLLVQLQRNRLRQVHSLTTTCVFLCALGLFSAGLFASFYVYQQYAQYRMRHFKGWCGVPYVDRSEGDDMEQIESLMGRMKALSDPLSLDNIEPRISLLDDEVKEKDRQPFKYFAEEFDLDLENEEYEKIEVPVFSKGRRGRFVHDFSLNKTAIIDLDGGRCFIMDLDRNRVLPPKSLVDMINKLESTYYDVDTEVVRETYRVVTPAMDLDEVDVGMYIERECYQYNTYRLEKMTSPIFKRSVSTEHSKAFTEFAGQKISQYVIMNLDSVPGRK